MDLEKDAQTRLVLLERIECIWEEPPSDATINVATRYDVVPPPGLASLTTTLVDDRFQCPGVLLVIMVNSRHDVPATSRLPGRPPRVQLEIAGKKIYDDCVGRILLDPYGFRSGETIQVLVTPTISLRQLEISLLGYEKPIQ